MRVSVTRESVCMGDDVHAPHQMDSDDDAAMTLGHFLDAMIRSRYCTPYRGARWAMFRDGASCEEDPIGEVSAEWPAPRFADEADRERRLDSLAPAQGDLRLHFRYYPQSVPLAAEPYYENTHIPPSAPMMRTVFLVSDLTRSWRRLCGRLQ